VGTVQWYIWECKLKKCSLSWDGCKTFCLEKLECMVKVSTVLREDMANSNISLRRHWRADGRRDGAGAGVP
jgi:hypothetical protein